MTHYTFTTSRKGSGWVVYKSSAFGRMVIATFRGIDAQKKAKTYALTVARKEETEADTRDAKYLESYRRQLSA